MGRLIRPFVLSLAASAALCLQLGAQAPQVPVFRATAENVPVFVTVTDKAGHLVTDLAREDFQVFDNGKLQNLTLFDNSPQPIRLIVLIDISGSMEGNVGLMRAASQQLVQRLRPDDLAKVGTFGGGIDIAEKFTNKANELIASLPRDIPPHGSTPLWNAIDQSITSFADVEGRHIVLVMSDSKDSGPMAVKKWISAPDLMERAEREDAMIYGIGMHDRPMPGGSLGQMISESFPDPTLGTVALATGGGYIDLKPRDDLGTAFTRVADELHSQYLLGFVPSNRDGKTHKLEVKVGRKDTTPRARKTYRAPK
jgi:Ca-activated chloride channel family protein